MVNEPLFPWYSNSPLGEALHSYDTELAIRILAEDHSAQKEETAMTTTHPQPQPRPAAQPRPVAPTPVDSPVYGQVRELQGLVEQLMGDQQTQAQAIEALNEKRQRQARQISELMELADQIMEDQSAQGATITELREKITELDGGVVRPRRIPDDTNDRIVAFLRDTVPGVWQSPGAVAVNLGLDSKSVAGRLERIGREGGHHGQPVERKGGRGTGSHPLYRVVPLPKPAPEGPTSGGH